MAHGPAVVRRISTIVAIAAATAIILAGCGSVAHNAAPSPAQLRADLRGSPPKLVALHRQANTLLGGGTAALAARLRELRGTPVVVTQWGSWCEACQAEYPYFQQLSARLGSRVAFIGNDVKDSSSGAKGWMRRFPASFPSYSDPDAKIALALSRFYAYDTPVTYLYTRKGVQYAHVGKYLSEKALRQEIRHYLGV
jgi:cytochrome c biogenesis protein CcmG/thiol:disulfide interchange protein DsbE